MSEKKAAGQFKESESGLRDVSFDEGVPAGSWKHRLRYVPLAILLAGVGGARTASVRLQAVADLAALAGAERSATTPWEDVGSRPCAAASEVAAANGVSVESCEVLGTDCRVVVSGSATVMGVSLEIRARARAGTEE